MIIALEEDLLKLFPLRGNFTTGLTFRRDLLRGSPFEENYLGVSFRRELAPQGIYLCKGDPERTSLEKAPSEGIPLDGRLMEYPFRRDLPIKDSLSASALSKVMAL